MRFTGKLVAVTGASSGIGRAIAQAFAAEGASVVGFARRFEAASDAAPAAGAVTEQQLDVSDERAVAARFGALPRLDVLVCSAGGARYAAVTELEVSSLREMLEAHVVGTLLCCRAALAHMRRAGGGHIVGIGSIAAHDTFPGAAGYTAAKTAQGAALRVLREEVRADDVRVTTIDPGATDTPLWDGTSFERERMMRPESLAELVVEIVARPEMSVEEVRIKPPGGNL